LFGRMVLRRAIELEADVVHIHGVWTTAVTVVPQLERLDKRVVVSPHGMLADYVLSKGAMKKRLFTMMIQRRALRLASCIHALNGFEALSIERYLGSHQQLQVIPNGIELDFENRCVRAAIRHPVRFLYCGRIAPVKRILEMLQAWARCQFGGKCELLLAGSGDGPYARSVFNLADALPNVKRLGYISGVDKVRALRMADFFLLNSETEGIAIAALEGLAEGLPGIISTGCHMPEVGKLGLGVVVAGEDELVAALKRCADMDDGEYAIMSSACVRYVMENHHWPSIGHRLSAVYQSLVYSGEACTE